jgi:hypothetical protein
VALSESSLGDAHELAVRFKLFDVFAAAVEHALSQARYQLMEEGLELALVGDPSLYALGNGSSSFFIWYRSPLPFLSLLWSPCPGTV